MTLTFSFVTLLRALLFASAIAHPSANAAIYKCVGADGKASFNDQPCANPKDSTDTKAPPKPASTAANKAVTAADLPAAGAATPNSNLQQYDTLCKEDRERLAVAATKVTDTISNQNFGLHKARVDKRCNPEERLLAAEKDVEGQALSCKIAREELVSLKNKPKPPPGYADQAAEIAAKQGWLNKNCPAATR